MKVCFHALKMRHAWVSREKKKCLLQEKVMKDRLCDSQVSASNTVTSSHQAEDVAEYRTI